jgi:hypothetical protein
VRDSIRTGLGYAGIVIAALAAFSRLIGSHEKTSAQVRLLQK